MSNVFLVGCGAGFSGDRIDAAISIVKATAESGHPGALIFETLAERTLALGQKAKRDNPELGYEPLLQEFLSLILADCVRHGIPIVSNFGAANPHAAARLIQRMASAAALPPLRIAIVDGDDINGVIDLAGLQVLEGDAGLVGNDTEVIAANVYLGAKPIADALREGAQVVVTGRVADPALTLGPLVAHFGWDWLDLQKIAVGTLAGHLLECGAQVTGGYFADPGYKDVPSPENIGFPVAEVSSNGDIVITKAKPPKSTQFEKGTSGNPKGRPKGAKSIGATLAKMGRQRIKITSNGQTRMVTMLEAMVMQLINQAAGGNLKAIREMLAAHRLFVEPEQAPEAAAADLRECDEVVIKNLQRRMQAFNKTETPEENN